MRTRRSPRNQERLWRALAGTPEAQPTPLPPRAADALAHRKTPTIAVFIEGGLIQDICFDGAVRVVVIDFDAGEDDPDDERNANYTTPDGDVVRVGVGLWERASMGANWATDASTVREALRAAGEV